VSPSESTPPVEPIAEGGVLLHIGPPKTGSTAIQNAMHSSRVSLAEHGVHYAGNGYRPRKAGWAVLGIGAPMGRPGPRIRRWNALVREIHAHQSDRVCLSNEDFARASPEAIERILDGLGAERVHLLYVVRPLDRLLPSTWQERIKARITSTYGGWLRLILGEPSEKFEYTNYWGSRDLPAVLDRWGKLVPPERIVLICSDDRDRELLPRAFESLLGLPAGALPMQNAGGTSNRGLTANESELMRRINLVAWRECWTPEEYLAVGQRGVAAGHPRAQPTPTHPKTPQLPDWAVERVRELSDRTVETVRSSGARVIGDPESLRFRPATQSVAAKIDTVQIDTAIAAVRGAIAGGRRHANKVAKRDDRLGPAVSDLSSRELLRVIAGRARRRLRRR